MSLRLRVCRGSEFLHPSKPAQKVAYASICAIAANRIQAVRVLRRADGLAEFHTLWRGVLVPWPTLSPKQLRGRFRTQVGGWADAGSSRSQGLAAYLDRRRLGGGRWRVAGPHLAALRDRRCQVSAARRCRSVHTGLPRPTFKFKGR